MALAAQAEVVEAATALGLGVAKSAAADMEEVAVASKVADEAAVREAAQQFAVSRQ